MRMRSFYGVEWSMADVATYATTLESYAAAGTRLYGPLGQRHLDPERVRDTLFPGLTVLVLVDGEHYPPVLLDALGALGADNDVVAAVMLGGGEKLSGPMVLGDLPIVQGQSQLEALRRALDEFAPEVVIDLSDEPVIDARARNRLIARISPSG